MKAFFAYPSAPRQVSENIHAAKARVEGADRSKKIHLWEENDISGRPLTDPIFNGIAESDVFIADVSAINFNVTFEIGYAVGLGKRVFLTRDRNFARDVTLADKIGIFDTLGIESYTDDETLAALLARYKVEPGIPFRSFVNTKAPVYLLQTPTSNTSMLAVISRVKKTRLGYKGFLPEEIRLPAPKAIDDVAECLGTIVPLIPQAFADSNIHNIRAAFVD